MVKCLIAIYLATLRSFLRQIIDILRRKGQ